MISLPTKYKKHEILKLLLFIYESLDENTTVEFELHNHENDTISNHISTLFTGLQITQDDIDNILYVYNEHQSPIMCIIPTIEKIIEISRRSNAFMVDLLIDGYDTLLDKRTEIKYTITEMDKILGE